MKYIGSKLVQYFWLLPITYVPVSVWLLRGHVRNIYIAAGLLVALTAWAQRIGKTKADIRLARWLAVLAAIGISAAVILSIEKVETLANPNHIASCSISPVLACSPVITSWQASAFGFPNPYIGIFGFAAVFTAAITIAAGATKLAKAWWRTLLAGIFGGAVFCTWLFYQGVYDIGKLCLYCMLVWLVTFTMLWMTAAYCVENKYVSFGKRINSLLAYKNELITLSIVSIFLLLFVRWSEYWLSLL